VKATVEVTGFEPVHRVANGRCRLVDDVLARLFHEEVSL